MSTLDEKVQKMRDTVILMYLNNRDAEIECPYYLLYKDEEIVGICKMDAPERWMNKLMRDVLAKKAAELGVDTFLHVSEAWMNSRRLDDSELEEAEKDEDGLPMLGPLKDLPDSIEVFSVMAGDSSGHRISVAWEIDRVTKDESKILVERSRIDNRGEGKIKGDAISPWDLWDRPSLREGVTVQ